MLKTKHLLTALVVFEAAIIGLLLANRYQITLAPAPLPRPTTKKRRARSRKSLPTAAKAPPRISRN